MEPDIYHTPEADLTNEQPPVPFYTVAPRKFLLLYFGTVGIYNIYWFYKNWSLFKKAYQESLWPVPRAIFYIFFTHSLFDKVNSKLEGHNYSWSPGVLATNFVLLSIFGNITERLAGKDIGSPFTDLVSLLILPVTGWLLYKAQLAINTACEDPQGTQNENVTPANIFWLVLGFLFWLLILVGIYDLFFGLEI